MRSVVFRIFLFCLVFSLAACEKENVPEEVTLPVEGAFGVSEVYLNGTLMPNYQHTLSFDTFYNYIHFSFYERHSPIDSEGFGFGLMPLQEGIYKISNEGILHEVARVGFSQIYDEDLVGYKYTLIEPENGYFHITYLDTINKEVKGHFKAKFRRTSKNGYKNGNLPKVQLYQGVFYDNYTHY